ncbi:MAG: TatD family deoxyribonuclease [Acidimicrobiia bacterium]|nr:TatD family deoxyribonuclease [Acidimicrobiia bacterium]
MTDSHCHIAGEEFLDDLPAVVERARAAGVSRALVILAAEDDAEISRGATVLAAWPECRFAVGVHPHHAKVFAGDPQQAADTVARRLEALPAARAVGEIGLDYHYDFSPRDVQHAVFRAQIRLALGRDLPVVIHTREAEDDTLRIIDEEGQGRLRGVFHCFTGDTAAATRALATGFFLSIPGVATFPKAETLRQAAAAAPGDRLLVETDSPYLAPIPFRGKRNEPAYVVRVVEQLAAVRGVTASEVGEATDRNFDRLFRP